MSALLWKKLGRPTLFRVAFLHPFNSPLGLFLSDECAARLPGGRGTGHGADSDASLLSGLIHSIRNSFLHPWVWESAWVRESVAAVSLSMRDSGTSASCCLKDAGERDADERLARDKQVANESRLKVLQQDICADADRDESDLASRELACAGRSDGTRASAYASVIARIAARARRRSMVVLRESFQRF